MDNFNDFLRWKKKHEKNITIIASYEKKKIKCPENNTLGLFGITIAIIASYEKKKNLKCLESDTFGLFGVTFGDIILKVGDNLSFRNVFFVENELFRVKKNKNLKCVSKKLSI